MGNSVGQINLDLGLNTKGFKNQLSGIQNQGKGLSSVFGKLGKVVAGAFAVKSVVSFAKECLKLGSDLQEVQNVVDVTFGDMSGKVDEFAKSAMTAYGLSEKTAKEYMGQFGAMSKAFGNTTEAAYAQSEALTALTGDVASFYNLETEEAFTKLKAVYTGETESLKSLGVVMTQTALDEFAMAQGMGKTTKQMTEQEKVSLRLAFVTDRLSAASGDFARTSDGWANQTRVLGLRFDALKASIGQGLINVFTPVIKLINSLVAKLQVAAEAFANFTTSIFGDAGGSGAATFDLAAESAGGIAENIDGAAGSAAKLKKSLMGFDKLNVISSPDSGDGGGGGGASGGIGGSGGAPKEAAASAGSAVGALDTLKQKLEEIANWTGLDKLWSGIKSGVDKIDFSAIKTNFEGIARGLAPIAQSAFDGVGEIVRSAAEYTGTRIGNMAAIYGKSVEIATGGISKFLNTQNGKISKWITTTATKISTGFNNLTFASETIFASFWTALADNELQIQTSISNVLTAFSDMGMTIGTVFSDMWLSITEGFSTWSAENAPLLEEFFGGTIESVTGFTDTVSQIISGLFESVSTWWEEDGKPVWDDFVSAVTDLGTTFMTFWNVWVKPIFDKIVEVVDDLWNNTLKPIWDNVLGVFSDIGECIMAFWNNHLKPVVDFIVEKVGPPVVKIFNWIADVFSSVFQTIGGIVNELIEAFRGVISFFTDIFKGDWDAVWGDIKQIFTDIWEAVKTALAPIINPIIGVFESFANGIIKGLNTVIGAINTISFDVPEGVPIIGGLKFGFDIPTVGEVYIPRLATGGYVAANTPQLAVIGDNKREGEIVAPESKIAEAVARGFAMVMSKMQQPAQSPQRSAPTPVIIKIGETDFWRGFIDFHNSEVARTGESPLLV